MVLKRSLCIYKIFLKNWCIVYTNNTIIDYYCAHKYKFIFIGISWIIGIFSFNKVNISICSMSTVVMTKTKCWWISFELSFKKNDVIALILNINFKLSICVI